MLVCRLWREAFTLAVAQLRWDVVMLQLGNPAKCFIITVSSTCCLAAPWGDRRGDRDRRPSRAGKAPPRGVLKLTRSLACRRAALRHRWGRRGTTSSSTAGLGPGRWHHAREAHRLPVRAEVLVPHHGGLRGVEVDDVTGDAGAVPGLACTSTGISTRVPARTLANPIARRPNIRESHSETRVLEYPFSSPR